MKYDAELFTIITPEVGKIAIGNIYGDKATHGYHPFRDGIQVFTSNVQDIVIEGEDTFLVTRNTVYKLTKPAVQPE